MTYNEAVNYLYTRTPLFQNQGQGAYKEGLENTYALDAHFNHPHQRYHTIHVAGTNGKGSCSHTIASILQAAGYRVGLYTSPHLLDFRERIRINGEMIPQQRVIDFIEQERSFFEPLFPSFFEITTALAFLYFAEQKIDVAVVEVGLGGRLDCTNIIRPVASVITNISFDHVTLLGNTLAAIAGEKAGIIKQGVPVVVGEAVDETRPVFLQKAQQEQAPILFAEDAPLIHSYGFNDNDGGIDYLTDSFGPIHGELGGFCQLRNTETILHTLPILQKVFPRMDAEAVRQGFAHVVKNTHLMGRWQQIADRPRTVCDTGHNTGGFRHIVPQLIAQSYTTLRIVLGMVNDKDINGVLSMLPKDAVYYFCQASVGRALPHDQLRQLAAQHGLNGNSYASVAEAYHRAQKEASDTDFIYVGGSTFVVADVLSSTL